MRGDVWLSAETEEVRVRLRGGAVVMAGMAVGEVAINEEEWAVAAALRGSSARNVDSSCAKT